MWKRIKRAIRIARRNSRARRQRKRTSEILLARSYGFFTISARGNVKDLKMSNKKTGLKGGGLFKSVHCKSNLKSLYQKGGESQW